MTETNRNSNYAQFNFKIVLNMNIYWLCFGHLLAKTVLDLFLIKKYYKSLKNFHLKNLGSLSNNDSFYFGDYPSEIY